MTNNSAAISAVAPARCISLVTYKRDGTAVPSPVWFNVIDGKIVVTTPRDAWKVKRVANNPKVQFAPCTQRGKVTGPSFTGTARVIPDAEIGPVLAAKKKRYFAFRFIGLIHRDQVAIEVTPDR